MKKRSYMPIVEHYEECLRLHGDSHLGVDWPRKSDAETRYRIMLEVETMIKIKANSYSLLDFGCGAAHLLEYILNNSLHQFQYSGLDISKKFIELSLKKFPSYSFKQFDVLESPGKLSNFDITILNGVFTEKRELTFEAMWEYFAKLVVVVFNKTNKAMAFNVMSRDVDWYRDDLFHLSLDKLSSFLCSKVTRNFIVRNDYGLYEYTVYLYK